MQGRWHEGYDRWAWIVEIKHWETQVTPSVVKKFIEAYTALEKEAQLKGYVKWFVNRSGFSPGAIKLLKEHNIYYSAAAEINELLHLFGIQRLLAFDTKSKAGKPKSKKGQQVQAKSTTLMAPKDPPQKKSATK